MLKEKYYSPLFLIILIILWQVSTQLFAISAYIVPSPISIIQVFITKWQTLLMHSIVTIFEAILGLILAIIIGLLIAICFKNIQFLRKLLMPYISSLQMIPSIAIAPLFAMWFGFGLFPKILLIVIFCSFPIIVNTVNSFDEVDQELLLYLKTLNATNSDLLRHLYIPSALPALFSGIRIATTYAMINAIFAEYMGAKYGLGVYLHRASSGFETGDVFAIIIVIVFISLSLLKLVDILARKIVKWS